MKPRFSSSAPLQMYFSLESFLAKVKIFRFWPKTMDYSQAFWPKLSSLFEVFLLPVGGCYEAEIFIIYSPSIVLLIYSVYPHVINVWHLRPPSLPPSL